MDIWNSFSSSLNLHKVEKTELFKTAHKKLKENAWYKPILDRAEDSSKVNRVYIVTGATSFAALLLLYNYGTLLITGCIGVIYPGYKTLSVLEHAEIETGRKWLIYWLIHGSLNFLEICLFFFYWVPGYWLIKSLFLLWCYAPFKRNGSDIIYAYLIHPFFQRNQEVIDNAISQMVKTAHSIYTDSEQSEGKEKQHES